MPELRKDPVTGRWVIIATERAKRPQDFASPPAAVHNNHDEPCPFCAGNERLTPPEICAIRPSGGAPNTAGWQVRVIPSVSPVLRIEGNLDRRGHGAYDVMRGIGAHEVIVESAAHRSDLSELSDGEIGAVIRTYPSRINDLQQDPRFKYVLLFKNHGRAAGAGRIAHVRSQLIATPVTPKRVKEELEGAKHYFDYRDRCLYCDIIAQERESGGRVVLESEHTIVLAPFASRFPFELCVLPKRHACDFSSASEAELLDVGRSLRQLLIRLKQTLGDPPYNYILHTAPFRRPEGKSGRWKTVKEDYHWHFEIMPRLTRVAGFEWGTGFYINPTPPEDAATYLQQAGQPAAAEHIGVRGRHG